MNELEKIHALRDNVAGFVAIEDFLRLVDGDLSHIGDAIIDGLPIIYRGKVQDLSNVGFSDFDTSYAIGAPNITVGSISFPAPESVVPSMGTTYWTADAGCVIENDWDGEWFDTNMLACGLVHLTKEAAKEHAEALISINKGEF